MSEEDKIVEDAPKESVLNLSDEDFASMPLPEGDDVPAEEPAPEPEGEEEVIPVAEEEDIPAPEGEEEVPGEEEEDVPPTDPGTEEEEASAAKDTPEKEPTAEEEEQTAINFEAEYQRILSPFKANGKQIQVANIDDALKLMQMGANYSKKMAGLKPNLKLMKMLENNKLLDEDKLSMLIDLSKKDPAALAKFLQDNEIDPLDINTEAGAEYKPGSYAVNDKEIELDAVLEEIQDTPTFQSTIDIVSKQWDQKSRDTLLANPSIIKTINDHVGSGIYEQISQIVDSERMVGRLTELSDIDAYKHVGDLIQANGGFIPQQAIQEQATPATPATLGKPQAVKKPGTTKKSKDRRKAAGSTKSTAGRAKQEFNPLGMSDEDFEKATSGQLF